MNNFFINQKEFIIEDYQKNNFTVKSYDKIYKININNQTLEEILDFNYNQGDYIVIDDYFKSKKINISQEYIYYVNAKEENKNINAVLNIIDFLYNSNFNKKNKLIVIGGGITQDIGGFVAGIFKRGINWIYVPTTLLSMTDSCIGGKVGINHYSKNMLGIFTSPSQVIISDYFLNTLSEDMVISGLGESLKLSIIGGEIEKDNFIKFYEKKDYVTIVKQSLVIKKAIIEFDELEKNERRVLNYGHTIGHAIEASTNFYIPHGIAVLFGMYYINILFNITNFEEINKYILNMIPKKYFIKFDSNIIIQHLKKDKKNNGDDICFIVPETFGNFNIKFVNIKKIEDLIKHILNN